MNHYIQTTPLNNTLLKAANKSALSQEEAIMDFFAKQTNKGFTPSQVHYYLTRNRIISPKTPITSVRRAMSLLTKDNRLVKTERVQDGSFGMPEHVWEISKEQFETTLFKQAQ